MVTFVIIAAAGLGLLTISTILDELFSFGDDLFSGVTLGAGGLIFGASGIIAISSGLPTGWSYVISGALFVGTLFMTRSLTGIARRSESSERPSLVGVEGIVTIQTGPNGGEVRLRSAHELEPRMAWSEQVIPTGAAITVVSESGTLKVEPLTTLQNEA